MKIDDFLNKISTQRIYINKYTKQRDFSGLYLEWYANFVREQRK